MVGSLGINVQGWGGGVLPNSDLFGQTEIGARGGCKNWTLILYVINVWSLRGDLPFLPNTIKIRKVEKLKINTIKINTLHTSEI